MILLRQRVYSAAGLAKQAERAAKRASKDAWQKSQAKSLFHSGFGEVNPTLSTSRRVLHNVGNAKNGSYIEDSIKSGVSPIQAKINARAGKYTAGHVNEGMHNSIFGEFARKWTR